MNPLKNQNHNPLLNALRKAFHISLQSKKSNAASADELTDMYVESAQRRRFIGNMLKTGVVISAPVLINACRKVADFLPPPVPNNIFKAQSRQPKIVIIGAGIAGLNCAYQLKKAGLVASVYEGSSRTGGRIFSKKDILAPGLYTELGGEFIDSNHKDMLNLCNEFGLQLLDTRTHAESKYARDSFYIDGRFHSEAEVIKAFQPFAARISADIDALPDEITFDNYNQAALQFDRISLHDYLDSIGMSGFLRKGIETAYLTEYGLETNVQSSINFLFLFSPDTLNGFDIFGSSDERYKIAGGNQSLTNALYQQVKSQVCLENQLVKIKENNKGYVLYFKNSNGATIQTEADMVVLSIPFTMLRNVDIDVNLPMWKRNAIERLNYGTNAKLLLGFDKRVWRNYQYSGYAFTDKVLQTGWDNSWGQPGLSGGYTVYQGGIKGLELGAGSPESQAPKFVAELDQMWPGCGKAFNGRVKRMHWPTYPFTLGSYSCYTIGQYTSIRGAERKTVGNLYFAGEHCSLNYQGFMNGGAETGRVAARKIVNAIKAGQNALE